ncbi:MAG: hypothetical protein LUE27_10615 [Clostridia bacterium]|nr:hypothetical protein [Clostridia bacterium]
MKNVKEAGFIKRQNGAFWLTVIAFVFTLTGVILMALSNSVDGYSLQNIGVIMWLSIGADVLLLVRAIFSDLLGAQSYLIAVINIIVMCLLMAAFCNVLMNRVVLLMLLATYDKYNTAGWTSLIESLAAIALFFISAIFMIFCAFNKDKRDRWMEKEARRARKAARRARA